MLPQPLPVPSSTTDNPPDLDCVREPAKSSIHALNPGATLEDLSNRKSTVSATADAILRGVEESSNAYPLLKSVARHLCLVLDNSEVQLLTFTFNI